MRQVEVDAVPAEPGPALGGSTKYRFTREGHAKAVGADHGSNLRRNEHLLVVPPCEPRADHLLTVAAGVGIGGVDDVDADIGRGLEHGDRYVIREALAPGLACAADPADRAAPEQHGRDVDPSPAERASTHHRTQ